MKLVKYTLWWRQKGCDKMETYASIKYAIRDRIDSLETMLNMCEKDIHINFQ